ncbi:MAG: response regulator [Anaerolineae bacterium]|nr:response regulator [Anaerolineae bacterium]
MAYKIVSVEDDAQIAELLQFVLQHDDLKVHFAHDGVTGLKLIRSMRPDLILLDVMLPELSGWEIYDTIRAEEALRQVPVIMVSVMAENRDRKAVFAHSPIDSYFTKPFDTRRLRVEIERMLGVRLWDMPPVRSVSTTEDSVPPVDPAVLADLFHTTVQIVPPPEIPPSPAVAPPAAADLDDTQPALPLRPMQPARPAKRQEHPGSDPVDPTDHAPADSTAQHGEASADT